MIKKIEELEILIQDFNVLKERLVRKPCLENAALVEAKYNEILEFVKTM